MRDELGAGISVGVISPPRGLWTMSGDICAPGIEWVGVGMLLSTPQGLARLPNRELCSPNVSCAKERRQTQKALYDIISCQWISAKAQLEAENSICGCQGIEVQEGV